jgi:PAS domain S-box-containing protein
MLISGYDKQVNKRNILALTVVPILTLLLVLTNGYHGLMFTNAALNPMDPTLPLVITFAPTYYVLVVLYSYTLMAAGFVMVARRTIATRSSFRGVGVQTIVAVMVPWVLDVAYVLDPNVFMNLEPSSLAISVAGAVLLWRIVKLPILGVLPVAHETLIDSMNEAIFVLDSENHIVDANPKAQSLLGSTLSQILGASIEKTWTEWPTVERALNSRAETGREVTLGVENDRRVYEVRSSAIGGLIGNASYQLVTLRDITEHKQMENALQESEQRLRRITDNMLDIVVETDLQGICKYASPSNKAILGYDPKDLVGSSLFDFVHPEDLATVTATIQRAVSTGRLWTGGRFECRYRHADGHYVWLENLANIVYDEKGQMIGGVIGARDITERKIMEEKLKHYSSHLEQLVEERTTELATSERKYRLLVDNMADVVFTIDLKGNYTFCTPQAEKMTGYTTQQLLSMNMSELIAPEHLPRVLKSLELRVRVQTELPPIRFDIIRANGTRLPIEVKTSLRLEGNKLVGLHGVARDITERKRMEDALRESEARFRELADLLPQIVFETDEKGNLTFGNQAGFAATGYTREDLDRGLNASRLFIPEERGRVQNRIIRILGGEKSSGSEYVVQRKDGSTFPVNMYVTATLREGKPVGLRGIAIDVTDRKRMEEQLLRSERLASIGEAAAMVGHDLRNPLQSTANTLYLAKKLLSTTKTKHKKEAVQLLEKLDYQIYYMNKIVSDLQDYARPVAGAPIETSLPDLVGATVSNVKIPRNVNVTMNVEAAPSSVRLDPLLFRRVLTNLILNAVQAMPTGGNLTITAGKIQDSTVLTVQDTGTGIPAENLEKIFNPFFTTKAQGQGLGLAVCKRLVEAQGFTITVKSAIGEGSTFTITMPSKSAGAV